MGEVAPRTWRPGRSGIAKNIPRKRRKVAVLRGFAVNIDGRIMKTGRRAEAAAALAVVARGLSAREDTKPMKTRTITHNQTTWTSGESRKTEARPRALRVVTIVDRREAVKTAEAEAAEREREREAAKQAESRELRAARVREAEGERIRAARAEAAAKQAAKQAASREAVRVYGAADTIKPPFDMWRYAYRVEKAANILTAETIAAIQAEPRKAAEASEAEKQAAREAVRNSRGEALTESGAALAACIASGFDRRQVVRFLQRLESDGNDAARNILFAAFRDNVDLPVSFDDLLGEARLALAEAFESGVATWKNDTFEAEAETWRELYGAMSRYLYSHATRHYKRLYIETASGEAVNVFDRAEALAELETADIAEKQAAADTVARFFRYITAREPKKAAALIATARELLQGHTLTEAARALGLKSANAVADRQAVLRRLYSACFADDMQPIDNRRREAEDEAIQAEAIPLERYGARLAEIEKRRAEALAAKMTNYEPLAANMTAWRERLAAMK